MKRMLRAEVFGRLPHEHDGLRGAMAVYRQRIATVLVVGAIVLAGTSCVAIVLWLRSLLSFTQVLIPALGCALLVAAATTAAPQVGHRLLDRWRSQPVGAVELAGDPMAGPPLAPAGVAVDPVQRIRMIGILALISTAGLVALAVWGAAVGRGQGEVVAGTSVPTVSSTPGDESAVDGPTFGPTDTTQPETTETTVPPATESRATSAPTTTVSTPVETLFTLPTTAPPTLGDAVIVNITGPRTVKCFAPSGTYEAVVAGAVTSWNWNTGSLDLESPRDDGPFAELSFDVDPGTYDVTLTVNGSASWEFTVTVTSGPGCTTPS